MGYWWAKLYIFIKCAKTEWVWKLSEATIYVCACVHAYVCVCVCVCVYVRACMPAHGMLDHLQKINSTHNSAFSARWRSRLSSNCTMPPTWRSSNSTWETETYPITCAKSFTTRFSWGNCYSSNNNKKYGRMDPAGKVYLLSLCVSGVIIGTTEKLQDLKKKEKHIMNYK